MDMEKILKEKTLLENQLVAYKLLYAEKSSKLMDTEDNYGVLYKKVENLNEKILVKDDIIKNLIYERDTIRDNYLNSNSNVTNKNDFFNNYTLTQRPSFDCVSNNNTISEIENNINNNKNSTNIKKGPGILLDGNKSILSKNNNNNNNNNEFEREKNFNSEIISSENFINGNNNNNNVGIGVRHNSCISGNVNVNGYGSENFNSNYAVSNCNYVNSQQKKLTRNKSNGLFGSIKNLFVGEKGKK